MSPEAERLRDIADAHADFSAEVFMLNVHGRKAVAEVDYLSAGDALELYETSSDDICVRTLDGVKLGTPLIPIQSDFRRALAEHVEYEVYMGGRNNGFMDNGALITIIVFYKLDGVPPSHLTIE
ncbi:hypothetical protein [uncultured Muribaculum sp.]|uniref:hypothetical protein n=1 Tax=uncultured Muribaculum sp. TaxID=1918613 RepID=UPI0025E673F0|nr:hypothetical protein [uncultured Muribaculum sp.]